jgi:hypothetical protein
MKIEAVGRLLPGLTPYHPLSGATEAPQKLHSYCFAGMLLRFCQAIFKDGGKEEDMDAPNEA